jgi:hypothetical protein
MTKTSWNLRFTEETHHTLTLEISEGDKLLGHTELAAVGVEALIQILMSMRMKMTPPVPEEFPTIPPMKGPSNPIYAVLDVPVMPGKLVMVRHEGLGWLNFLFPQKEADKLAHGLLEQPALAKAPAASKTLN